MSGLLIDYGPEVERSIAAVEAAIRAAPEVSARFPARWLAISLIDEDGELASQIEPLSGGAGVLGSSPEHLFAIAGARYGWINEVAGSTVTQSTSTGAHLTDRIDAILTNRWLGLPIFLAVMWVVFKLTTDVASVFLDWIDEAVSGPVTRLVSGLVGALGLEDTWVESLITDGVLAGVGAVLVFIPILVTLYIALAVLEDSGYMARAAFVMDRVMGTAGLPGKSFLPMLVGFGCTVPAIYATRTLENQRDRTLTALLVPFMSCSARLPVYVLFASAFFPGQAGTIVFLMYLLGIGVALVIGMILRRTVLPEEGGLPAILEMPPYRRPTLRSIRIHTWTRTRAFLADAGTIILVTSVVVWLLLSIPIGTRAGFADVAVEDSAFAATARVVAPALEPLGFGTEEATGALISGFIAKEVVVSTMGQVYGEEPDPADEEASSVADDLSELVGGFAGAAVDTARALPSLVGLDLRPDDPDEAGGGLTARIRAEFEASSDGHGPAAGLAFMVFVLLYTPCMAAIAAERRELGTRWMWLSVGGQTALAWMAALVVFQVGRLVG